MLQRGKKYRVMDDSVTKWKRGMEVKTIGNNDTKESSSQHPDRKPKSLQCHDIDIQRIDFYAFIVSAFTFLIFNVGYWIAFLASTSDN